MNDQMRDYRLKLKYDYGAWIEQILKGKFDGQIWNGYIVTFMFNPFLEPMIINVPSWRMLSSGCMPPWFATWYMTQGHNRNAGNCQDYMRSLITLDERWSRLGGRI